MTGPGTCRSPRLGQVLAIPIAVVQPGKPPDIHKDEHSITIKMDVAPPTSRARIRIVLRCDRHGDIFASIERGSDEGEP
jgi:hypothetical protein